MISDFFQSEKIGIFIQQSIFLLKFWRVLTNFKTVFFMSHSFEQMVLIFKVFSLFTNPRTANYLTDSLILRKVLNRHNYIKTLGYLTNIFQLPKNKIPYMVKLFDGGGAISCYCWLIYFFARVNMKLCNLTRTWKHIWSSV